MRDWDWPPRQDPRTAYELTFDPRFKDAGPFPVQFDWGERWLPFKRYDVPAPAVSSEPEAATSPS